MQKQRLCYKTNDLLYSARIYKSLMSFTTPWEPYLDKKNKTQQNSKTDCSWLKKPKQTVCQCNTLKVKHTTVRDMESSDDFRRGEVGIWECIDAVCHSGPCWIRASTQAQDSMVNGYCWVCVASLQSRKSLLFFFFFLSRILDKSISLAVLNTEFRWLNKGRPFIQRPLE